MLWSEGESGTTSWCTRSTESGEVGRGFVFFKGRAAVEGLPRSCLMLAKMVEEPLASSSNLIGDACTEQAETLKPGGEKERKEESPNLGTCRFVRVGRFARQRVTSRPSEHWGHLRDGSMVVGQRKKGCHDKRGEYTLIKRRFIPYFGWR